ncbi:MAG: TM1812 family CRISPR-associated protein [Spirochaetaceae bacterium]|jgi:hypothetical protein|nr:TM1812 family CRISPR-associated protein [Spirochaetaceae bacterium]
MKTVIVTMPMKERLYRFKYPVVGNASIEYDGEVSFPVNGLLARTLERGEEVKIIYIITKGGDNKGGEHTRAFRQELDEINKNIGARFSEETIELEFDPKKDEFKKLLYSLIEKIGEDAQIIADITFGSKPFPFTLLCALNYAENFHNADLLYIVYGKVDWIDGEPTNPKFYDITSNYYLQKLIGSLEGRSLEIADALLESFFEE